MIITDTIGIRVSYNRLRGKLGHDNDNKFKNYPQYICKPALDENSKEHSLKDRPRPQSLPSASNLIENIQVSSTR